MKKPVISFVVSFILALLTLSEGISQCTPGTNFSSPKLLVQTLFGPQPEGTDFYSEVPAGTPVQTDKDYVIQVTISPTMDPNQSIVVIASADGFGYVECIEGSPCEYKLFPPPSGTDCSPTPYAKNVRFNIHTSPDPSEIGDYLYFRIRADCGPNFPRAKGTPAQFTIPTYR